MLCNVISVILIVQFTGNLLKMWRKKKFREGKEEWVPFDSSPYCSASGFDAASPVLHEVVDSLHSLGIAVEQVNGIAT